MLNLFSQSNTGQWGTECKLHPAGSTTCTAKQGRAESVGWAGGGEKEEPLVSSKPLKQKNPPHMQATRERGERDKHRCGLQALSWGKAGQRRRVLAAVKLSLTQKMVTFWKETVEAGSQNFIHCLLFSAAQQIYRKMSPEHQCMRDMDYCAEKKRKNKSAGLVRFSPFFCTKWSKTCG